MIEPVSPTQIQIQPVDNGFLIQAVAIDGKGKSFRLVATSVEDAREKLHGVVDKFHAFEAEKAPPVGEESTSGPTGPETPAGA